MGATSEIEDVFKAMHPRLWRGLIAFTGSADIASDAEAEAFAQAISRGAAIRDLEAWIWTSSFHIASGLLAKRSEAMSREMVVEHFHQETVVELIEMLGDLSEQQRRVTILRYVGNYQPSEIAELLGTTAGTVRVQLHRSHESLRELMGERQ